MKKFNIIILLTSLAYIIIAFISGYLLYNQNDKIDREYRVEINRIEASIFNNDTFISPDLSEYEYITSVSFITVKDINNHNYNKDFFSKINNNSYEINPLFKDNNLIGYVRYEFVNKNSSTQKIIIPEISLFLIFLLTLGVLFYLKITIIKPFGKFINMPYDLANGHLKTSIPTKINGYFSKFLWGINMLKDNLDATKRKEQKLEKEKKMLILSISHDIKTPLNAIKLYSKALEDNLIEDESEKLLTYSKINEKADQIQKFVNDIVKSSSENILDIEVVNSDFYLKELVDKIKESYTDKAKLSHTKLIINNYTNCILKGDFHRSYEVVENIIENAFKYGDGLEISISFYEEDYCQLIRIHNTGTPVTPNELNHLFDSFFRGKNINGKEGSGLGLYICKDIMKKMNGDIFAEITDNGMDFVMVFQE